MQRSCPGKVWPKHVPVWLRRRSGLPILLSFLCFAPSSLSKGIREAKSIVFPGTPTRSLIALLRFSSRHRYPGPLPSPHLLQSLASASRRTGALDEASQRPGRYPYHVLFPPIQNSTRRYVCACIHRFWICLGGQPSTNTFFILSSWGLPLPCAGTSKRACPTRRCMRTVTTPALRQSMALRAKNTSVFARPLSLPSMVAG
jgi:hypothetical protein